MAAPPQHNPSPEPDGYPDPDPLELSHKQPHLSASRVFWFRQWLLIAVLIGGAAYYAYHDWIPAARVFVYASTIFYVVFTFYRLMLHSISLSSQAEMQVSESEIGELRDEDLPIYSVIVPMYHEGNSVAGLVDAVCGMDYPAEKLDVQLLVEDDDEETIAAVERLELPPNVRATMIPYSLPRTKPKACNIGLKYAKGKYLVIYDAEDRPEKDQLKKVIVAYRRLGADVICIQSKLNFYNPRQNLFTRWFTAEYSSWFDLSLPGLSHLKAVIPLGGTSNHFVTSHLRDLLGWDAYNVAEDCDLGVRIYRAGFSTRMLNTTTWEEACSRVRYWIPQRSRWMKGYMQTYLVHTRKPIRLLRDLGIRNFIHFQLLIGGIIVCFLLNPIYWALAALWMFRRMALVETLFPLPVFVMAMFCLFAGNFAFVYIGALGCYTRKYYDLVKYALLTPPYWMLMSYAGWRALFQLITNPFHWEKTKHCLTEATVTEPAT